MQSYGIIFPFINYRDYILDTVYFKGVLLDAKNMLRISSVSYKKHIRTKTCISLENDYTSH